MDSRTPTKTTSFRREEYIGKKTVGNYSYYAFKQSPGMKYRIARKDLVTEMWDYYWGTGGLTAFSSDWANPAALSFSLPLDA